MLQFYLFMSNIPVVLIIIHYYFIPVKHIPLAINYYFIILYSIFDKQTEEHLKICQLQSSHYHQLEIYFCKGLHSHCLKGGFLYWALQPYCCHRQLGEDHPSRFQRIQYSSIQKVKN